MPERSAPSPEETVAEALHLLAARPVTLGVSRLLCIDGRSGAGKTRLAGRVVAAAAPRVTLLRMEDFYEGWNGLLRAAEAVEPVLRELAAGRTTRHRCYDWHAGRFGADRQVEPRPLVVLEGVGAGDRRWTDLTTALVWLDAPAQPRLERTLARDGEQVRAHLGAWAADETTLEEREHPRDRADLLVETASWDA